MMKKKKIFIFTSTRADYGLLRWVITKFQNSSLFETHVIVGGAHLSEEYGYTIKEILKDNVSNIIQLPFLSASSGANSLVSSVGNGLIQTSQNFSLYRPDLMILLGDRYELFIMSTAALMYQIPIVHLHGGERTEGVIDEQVRHAITKIAHVHMPSMEFYAENISKMGEEDWRIHIVGAPGLENIKKTQPYTKEEIFNLTGVDLSKPTFLCTYNPVTLEGEESIKWQVKNLLKALSNSKIQIVFTRPNAEVGSDKIVEMIKDFVAKKENTHFFDSLGTRLYLSFVDHVKAVIGNSSSGIIEVPAFQVPTVNIGDRQCYPNGEFG
jgi:GDP/UDP-N,N'-diacetylbacillosamine 2-epimerase (hydrolysing)